MTTLENQLWLWLDACEEGKPMGMAKRRTPPSTRDQVVPFLQYEVREGGDGDEVVVP